MDKDDVKARGLKHLKNKKKYNKKSSIHAPPKLKTKVLESNWDRYEHENIEQKVSTSTDFSILANTPITHGSHFQFKSDKDIALEISETDNSSELFNLDLSLLDRSLATIPFCVRSGIEERYFTENQRRVMATTVQNNIENYVNYLKNINTVTNSVGIVFESEDSESSEGDEPDDNNKLDNESFTKETLQSDIKTSTKSSGTVESDLEQWLDDILDD